MSRQSAFWSLVGKGVTVPSLAMFLTAIPAMAQARTGDYIFLVASGFICDPSDSSSCPAVVKSAQGDTYEMSGVGTFSTERKSVTGAGTFTHKSPNGNSLEAGAWVASEFVSFDSYGLAPGSLAQRGLAFGPPQFGPRGYPTLSSSIPAGGLAVIRIRLLPMWGPPRIATLQVNCAYGKVPDERMTEGIRLDFEGGGAEFDEEVSGRTLFVLTLPGASVASKAPASQE